ncbi:hypothetical protein B0H16DRAFT_1469417, partial [Mycena metata]
MPRRIERYVEENTSYTPAVGREAQSRSAPAFKSRRRSEKKDQCVGWAEWGPPLRLERSPGGRVVSPGEIDNRGLVVVWETEWKHTMRFAAPAPLRNGPHIGNEKMLSGKDVDSPGLERLSFSQGQLFHHKLERKVDGSCTEYMTISSLAAQRCLRDGSASCSQRGCTLAVWRKLTGIFIESLQADWLSVGFRGCSNGLQEENW